MGNAALAARVVRVFKSCVTAKQLLAAVRYWSLARKRFPAGATEVPSMSNAALDARDRILPKMGRPE